jgi:branched-chain amino acid transport system permease protein
MLTDLANATIRGIQSGAIYGLVALGMTVILSATNVFNFAHGQMVMLGSVLGAVLLGSMGVPVVLALLATLVFVSALGALTEIVAVRPLKEHQDQTALVSTLAVAVLVASITTNRVVNGKEVSDTRPFPEFLPWKQTWHLGDIVLNPTRIFPVVVLALAVFGVWILMTRTNVGRALRALADDREAARMRGLPIGVLASAAFALGAGLGALAGFSSGPITQASVTGGIELTIAGFAAMALGGIGTTRGAVVGGLALGLVEQYTVTYLDSRLQLPIVLLVLVAMLYVRPAGLLGRELRRL